MLRPVAHRVKLRGGAMAERRRRGRNKYTLSLEEPVARYAVPPPAVASHDHPSSRPFANMSAA